MAERAFKLGILQSEFTRYAVGRLCGSIGLCFGFPSGAALSNMHSARLVLGLDELREALPDLKNSALEVSSKAAKIISSSVFLCTGNSSLFKVAECVYLAVETANSGLKVKRIHEALKKRSESKELRRMEQKAAAAFFCDLAEFFAVGLELWPVYAVVTLLRVSYFLFDRYGDQLRAFQKSAKTK